MVATVTVFGPSAHAFRIAQRLSIEYAGEPDWWIPWRIQLGLVALSIALLAGRFVWAPGQLDVRLGPHPDSGRFYLAGAHLTYRASCLVQIGLVILVLRRLAAVVGLHAALQARLRVIRWIMWYMLLYIAYEATSVVVWQLPDLSSRVFRLRSLFLLVAIVAPNAWYLTGLELFRRLATVIEGPLASWHRWWTYRRLYPLWAALYPIQPSVSHLPPPRRRGWRPDRPTMIAICRMITEIHDWTITLWPYQVPHAVVVGQEIAREARLLEHEASALIEAIALAASLENWHRSNPISAHAAAPQPGRPTSGGATLADEIAALVPVADLFARSPLVTLALARLAEESPSLRGARSGTAGRTQSGSTTRVV